MISVFLGGEGRNELGTRGQRPMGEELGVIEALLLRVRPAGWHVSAAREWKSIRKFRAGAGRQSPNHADAHNVLSLVIEAYEKSHHMLAFIRDHDGDDRREHAVRQILDHIAEYGFAEGYGYQLSIVGGVPRPSLEGWILCLLGVRRTDGMSKGRAASELATHDIELKSTARYVEIAETCALPPGEGSLPAWLALADAAFRRLIDGVSP